jgi:hypothetical protein
MTSMPIFAIGWVATIANLSGVVCNLSNKRPESKNASPLAVPDILMGRMTRPMPILIRTSERDRSSSPAVRLMASPL